MKTLARAIATGLLCSLFWPCPAADACLNGVEISRKEAVRLISEAESLLAAGNASGALKLLQPKLGTEEGFDISSEALEKRLLRLWSVARMRAGGTGEIADAIDTLRAQLRSGRDDPWLKTRLAEALSRTEKGAKEARKLLEALVQKDLIVDAEGFATLARLRKQASDSAGAEQALQRCKAMSKQPEICSDAPLPPPRKTARLQVLGRDDISPLE